MTTTYGMITNYNDVKTIETNGTPCKITIHRTHGDEIVDGYEYDGHRYTIGTDRDGWPNGLGEGLTASLPTAKKILLKAKKVLDKPV